MNGLLESWPAPLRAWATALALLLALLAPFAMAWHLRRRALTAGASGAHSAWFFYARRVQGIQLAAWLLWMMAVAGSGIEMSAPKALAGFGAGVMAFGVWLIAVLPPLANSLALQALAHDVQRRLHGTAWSTAHQIKLSLLQSAALLVPLAFVIVAAASFFSGHTAAGAVAAAGVLLSRLWMLRLYSDTLGLAPHAVTTGPLRDALFELARRANVPLRQLYVIPMMRARMANAFAAAGQTVILTDYLLENLSQRETRAVMAHEIGHLRSNHPRKLGRTLMLSVMVATAAALFAPVPNGLVRVLAFGVAFMLAGFVTTLVSRRFERQADAAAAELTGDPEAMITALARLSRLNHVPIDWGSWAEKSLTHPSTRRRALALARAAQLPPDRVNELLSELAAPDPGYSVAMPAPEEQRFTTMWKLRITTDQSLLMLAILALAPAIVIALLPPDRLTLSARLVTDTLAFVVTAAAVLAATDVLGVRPARTLKRATMERLIARGIDPERCAGWYVGLSPNREPRLYEHHSDWDVGWLFLLRERLCFVGDEVSFEIPRSEVARLEIGPGTPSWFPAPRVVVSWQREDAGTEGAVTFRPADVRSVAAIAKASRELGERLEAWRRGVIGAHPEAPLPALNPPPSGEVTSQSPRELVSASMLMRALVLAAVAVAAAAAAFDLPFDWDRCGFLDAVVASWTVLLLQRVPLWRQPRTAPAPAHEVRLERAA